MTYEYECRDCDYQWDQDQKITEQPATECPRCKQTHVRRLISGKGAFVLQGSGWFRTGGY